MMTDPKQPRKQRKGKAPLLIQDLELNKETLADLTEAQAEHVKGGMLEAEAVDGDEIAATRVTYKTCPTYNQWSCRKSYC